jgi:hypothetical protein
MGGPIDDGDAGNALRRHQFSRAAAGPVGIGTEILQDPNGGDAKFRWHGARGASEVNYCDFGNLSSIIVTNWGVFENVLGNIDWAKVTLDSLEKSRNIVMHGGTVAKEDVERISMNIRDWIRQTG